MSVSSSSWRTVRKDVASTRFSGNGEAVPGEELLELAT